MSSLRRLEQLLSVLNLGDFDGGGEGGPLLTIEYEDVSVADLRSEIVEARGSRTGSGVLISRALCAGEGSGAPVRGKRRLRVVRIGDHSIPLIPPENDSLVPCGYLSALLGRGSDGKATKKSLSSSGAGGKSRDKTKRAMRQELLRSLQWMLKKEKLGSDMFLVGEPGPQRRRLAMAYCELTQRETEYVRLSQDTTEADLKQRREIRDKTAFYVDCASVRAALHGRVLVLDGIEKAERNVLPVLNNLLENREMQLEDGRFLTNPKRFDALLETHGEEQIKRWRLVRASERFRVIALGLPVPPYFGNALDPPLRSRFQAHAVGAPATASALELMKQAIVSARRGSVALQTTSGTAASRERSFSKFPLLRKSLSSLAALAAALKDFHPGER